MPKMSPASINAHMDTSDRELSHSLEGPGAVAKDLTEKKNA
jgi:hypothetical protein